MGNWKIEVEGIGSHGNEDSRHDSDLLAIEFVKLLRKAGQNVTRATFTSAMPVNIVEVIDGPDPYR